VRSTRCWNNHRNIRS